MKKLTTKITIGSLVAAGAISGAIALSTSSATAAPNFQLPFPCGQSWEGQTRTNHSPAPSVDFNRANDYGDTVVASAAGTVSRVGNEGNTSYGRWVEVRHSGGYTTRYAHLSLQSVRYGQVVKAGQKLGNVGSTGGSTGPHLHFEQRLNGTPIKARFNGAQAYYWGSRTYTSKNCGGGSSTPVNPYSPTDVCGAGSKVIDSKAITGGKVYLTYNSRNGENCVVTLKTSKLNTKTRTSAFLEVKGGTRSTDSGSYQSYAGPVKKKAPNKCVKWGGSVEGASYTSPFEHCG
jgi:hypothetical protein